MAVLEEYLTRQKYVVHTALTGTGNNADALSVMSTAGIRGIGDIKHYALTYQHSMLTSIQYVDTGSYTRISKTSWSNGTAMLIQTQARMYMVSRHYMEGTAMSMQEVRVIAPIKKECALAVHTQHGRYQVIQTGQLFCMEYIGAFTKYTLSKGDIIHIEDKEHCYNKCIQIGFKGYMQKDKHMPMQPTVHPADMKQFQQDKLRGDQTAAHKDRMIDDGHQRIHDQLEKDIRDSEDIIQEIRDNQDNHMDLGVHFGVTGIAISVLTILALLLICVRCGWKRCKATGDAQAGE